MFDSPPQIIDNISDYHFDFSLKVTELSITENRYKGTIELDPKTNSNKINQIRFNYIAIGSPSKPTPPNTDLSEEAANALVREETRGRAKLVLPKNSIDINCLKDSIISTLSNYDFQLKYPFFDEIDRLETNVRTSQNILYPDRNYYEATIVKIHLIEKDNNYRLYAVARGAYRRRMNDIESEEKISQDILDSFIDKIISNINLEDCYKKKQLYLSLSWDTETDIDIHVHMPNGERCSYYKPTVTFDYLNHDNRSGPKKDPENVKLTQNIPGTYKVIIHYFKGETKTNISLMVTDIKTTTTYKRSLMREGDAVIFNFENDNGSFYLIGEQNARF